MTVKSATHEPEVDVSTATQARNIVEIADRLQLRKLPEKAKQLIIEIHQRAKALENVIETITVNHFSPPDAGVEMVERMKATEGGAWTGKELEQKFGLSSANLHRRRKEKRILFWCDAKNDYHYPKWQFNEAGAPIHGIEDVLQIFQSNDEWRVMRYFLGKRQQLDDRRPLDLLREDASDRVIAHARIHAEENTW